MQKGNQNTEFFFSIDSLIFGIAIEPIHQADGFRDIFSFYFTLSHIDDGVKYVFHLVKLYSFHFAFIVGGREKKSMMCAVILKFYWTFSQVLFNHLHESLHSQTNSFILHLDFSILEWFLRTTISSFEVLIDFLYPKAKKEG